MKIISRLQIKRILHARIMNIMSLDAAYGHGTIQDMMISGDDDREVTASTPKVNTKIKPMELLPDTDLNIPPSIQGYSSLSPSPPAAGSSSPPPLPQFLPQIPPPTQPLPHPRELLQVVAPDERLEAELQLNLAAQQAAQPPLTATNPTPLRGGNARFAKYDGSSSGNVVVVDGGVALKPSFTTNVTSFYQRNKIGILIVVILFFLFIGVLIAVVVKSSSSSATTNILPVSPSPSPSQRRPSQFSMEDRAGQLPFSVLSVREGGRGEGGRAPTFLQDVNWTDSASQTGR
jgi:hypothetical protein